MRKPSRGLTLIELMVVIAVIAIVTWVLLPLIHRARENARKARCQNNLQQLGIAFSNYYTTWQAFPTAIVLEKSGTNGISTTGWSAQARILPYLDQASAFNGANFEISRKDPANLSVISLSISTFLCPSEIKPEPMKQPLGQTGVLNYAVCRGGWNVWEGIDKNVIPEGTFVPNASRQIKDFTDGLSNTMLMAEVKSYQAGSHCPDFRLTAYPVRVQHLFPPYAIPSWTDDPLKVAPAYDDHICTNDPPFSFHTDWSDGNVNASGFTTAWPPNKAIIGVKMHKGLDLDLCGRKEEEGGPTFAAINARGRHEGGVNVLFADGSVRFVKNTVTSPIWQGIGTPSSAELMYDKAY